MNNVLFILKRGGEYGNKRPKGGLFNSARFVCDMLNQNDRRAALEHAVDANDIDRLVTIHRPEVVIVEALWVVPSKFAELQRLHPDVRWIVRLHSELPFLAQEGIAIEWIKDYCIDLEIEVAVNSWRIKEDLEAIGLPIGYLPNYYPITWEEPPAAQPRSTLNEIRIGCFGAIRPLKNHLTQAVAAMKYANETNNQLQFCVNETNADRNVLRNLEALFKKTGHVLVKMEWLDHAEFLRAVASVDLAMQCSLSETFNIVSADAVSQGIPVVVSPEVSWTVQASQACATDVNEIVRKMHVALSTGTKLTELNFYRLMNFSDKAMKVWLEA